REPSLEGDRDVAETDSPVAVVDEGPRDDADRIREVDDPGVVDCPFADLLCDLEHDRHRAQGLCEAARARGLLADAAAGKRQRLVAKPGLLAADAKLDENEAGPIECTIEVAGERQPACESPPLEHATGQAA